MDASSNNLGIGFVTDLSSHGHLRSRGDTRGHPNKTIRDREALGSNPGPPTIATPGFILPEFGSPEPR
jgi:hypothetical protein